jgi:hypothetical protein
MSYPYATAVHLAHLNGDGRADYIWVGPSGQTMALYNAGFKDNPSVPSASKINWVPAGEIATGAGKGAEIWFAVCDNISSNLCYLKSRIPGMPS